MDCKILTRNNKIITETTLIMICTVYTNFLFGHIGIEYFRNQLARNQARESHKRTDIFEPHSSMLFIRGPIREYIRILHPSTTNANGAITITYMASITPRRANSSFILMEGLLMFWIGFLRVLLCPQNDH